MQENNIDEICDWDGWGGGDVVVGVTSVGTRRTLAE